MSRVLIVYATVEGQTARIAERIARQLRNKGLMVATHRADQSEFRRELANRLIAFDGVIVGASIHYGRHASYLRALVKQCCAELAARPGAFSQLA